MRLSKIYSNQPGRFSAVSFAEGLNVILAEIRLPENKDKDSHNLGKTTLGRLLDFCLISKRDAKFFLFKHSDQFRSFVFFLEVKLDGDRYVTIKRSVAEASKISFKKHAASHQDYSALPPEQWDHLDVPFERARELLDSLLGLRALKPWDYRKGLGYLLRSQDDYRDIFQLRRFAGPHADWKPFLAHILGFDAELIGRHYEKERKLEDKQSDASTISKELMGSIADAGKIEGMLLLKQQDVEKKTQFLEAFDFRSHDIAQTNQLVDEVDEKIAGLNTRRYSLRRNRKKITTSLEDNQILFDPEDAKRLFEEANVLFEGQVKRDFHQLISFNEAISNERRIHLQDELGEIDEELHDINQELAKLGSLRSEILSSLSTTDVFEKYKLVTSELVTLRAEITSLERQREFLHRLQELYKEIRDLEHELTQLQTEIEEDVKNQNSDKLSVFSSIRLTFNEIIEQVIHRKALLSVSVNKNGHLEYKGEILDDSGNTTSAALGFTYRKLLCIAFDFAVIKTHMRERFPKFAFHDGAFESLDPRKKENLLSVLRSYSDLGIQSIVTLIDSDLPPQTDENSPVFDDEEIVLRLHDEGESGRLFKMAAW